MKADNLSSIPGTYTKDNQLLPSCPLTSVCKGKQTTRISKSRARELLVGRGTVLTGLET